MQACVRALAASALRGRGAVAAVDALCPAARAALGTRRWATLPPASAFPPLRAVAMSSLPAAAARFRWGGDAANRAMSSEAAGFAPATVFAVAEIGGKQYKVTVNDSIVTENMIGRRVGEEVVLEKVMLVGDKGNTTVGQPYVKGASVTAVIEQLTLAPKVYIFKKRRRKNSRRLRGFRAAVTSLRIRSIATP